MIRYFIAFVAAFTLGSLAGLVTLEAAPPGFAASVERFAVEHPPWYEAGKAPETPAAYRERIAMVTRVVIEETASGSGWPAGYSHADRAAAVWVKTWNESQHFKLEVHDGSQRGDKGRAICLGQVHRNGMPAADWVALAGADEASTRRCVRTVQRFLLAHVWRCGHGEDTRQAMARAFVGYGTGASCDVNGRPWAMDRAKMWEWLRRGWL